MKWGVTFSLKEKHKIWLILKKLSQHKYKFPFLQGDFSFDSTFNILTIAKGGLKYYPNTFYQFTIQTMYLKKIYSQVVNLKIDPASIIPIANLK